MGDTNAVRGDARAATNDASTGVQAQLPRSSGGPRERGNLKLRRCVTGITTKKPSGRYFAAPFLVCYSCASGYRSVLILSEPEFQRGRQGLAYLTALLRSETERLSPTIRQVLVRHRLQGLRDQAY